MHAPAEDRLVKSFTAQTVSFSESKYFKYWRAEKTSDIKTVLEPLPHPLL